MREEFYDIVVLGSGLVGASFLLAQARAFQCKTLKMAVIDKQSASVIATSNSEAIPNSEARAIALSHSSVTVLKTIIDLSDMTNITAIKEVHVSAKGHFGTTCIKSCTHQLDALGAVVDADSLNQNLNQIATKLPMVTFFRPDEIKSCVSYEHNHELEHKRRHEHGHGHSHEQTNTTYFWKLTLSSGKMLITRLLLGADGTESFVRKRFGVGVNTEDYHQQALVSNIMLSGSHHNIAYERFLSKDTKQEAKDLHESGVFNGSIAFNGSVALLPFGENRVKCILIAPEQQAKNFMSFTDQNYLALVQEAFGFRMGRFKAIGKRYSYPLKHVSAETLYGPGWVLLGNAANTLHPLAAQGFNLGLRDAMALAEILGTALRQEKNIADPKVLQAYASMRKSDHFNTGLFTETLVKRKSYLPLGILCSEFLPGVKSKITLQGLGVG